MVPESTPACAESDTPLFGRGPRHAAPAGHGRHIGRVGALAVALGVGMAITITAPTADAEPSGSTDSTSAGESDPKPGNAGGRQQRRPAGSSPAADSPAASDPRRRARVPTAPKALPPADASKPGSGGVGVAPPAAAVTKPEASALLGNGRSGPAAGAASVQAVDAPAVAPVKPAAAAVPAPVLPVAVLPVVTAVEPAVRPPAMSAAPARAARSAGIRSAFAPLVGGGTPQAPVNSPVSWVMVAAALRQIGQPRASVSVAATVYPSAAVAGGLTAGTPTVRSPNVKTGVVTGSAVFVNTAGGTLTYSAPAVGAGGGAVSINASTGAFTYTPTQSQRQNAGLATTDTFTVTASNGSLTAFQTVTVPVDPGTPVAGTPWVGTPASWTGAVSGQAKFTDDSGRTLAFSAPTTTAAGGAVSINAATGAFTYTPTQSQRRSAGLNTTDTFTVTSTNGVRTTTQTITVAVDPGTPVAGTPWLRTPNASTGVVTGIAKFSDGSGRTLTYSAPSTSAGGGAVSINASTGDFTYTPTVTQRRNALLSTTDSFTVTVSNGVRSTTQTITVGVDPGTPRAGNPTVGSPNVKTGVVTGTARGTDSVGGPVTYNGPGTTAGGGTVTVNASTGAFTYTPTQSQRQNATLNTTDSFAVTISNGARTTTQTITVGVDPGTPTASTPSVGPPATWSGVVTGRAKGTDSVGGPLTFTAPVSSAGGGTVSINSVTGDFVYTPSQSQRRSAGLNTTDTFVVTISNGARTTTRTIAVAVDPGLPVAGTPWLRTPNASTGVVTGIAKFSDGSGRTLTYSAPSTSAGGGAVSINASTGDFTYTPTVTQRRNALLSTTDSFTVTVSNGVRSTTQTITVGVDPGTPRAGNPSVGTPNVRTGVVTGTARGTDSVGGPVSYAAQGTSVGGGTVTINASTGAFTYTPTQSQRQNAALNTTDSFAVTISNGARTTTQTITVGVDPGTPTASTPSVGPPATWSGVVTGRAKGTDSVGGPLTFTAPVSSAGGGTVSINSVTGDFVYTPSQSQRRSAGANSTDSFTVTISNGARTTTQTIAVAVDPGLPVAGAPWLRTPNSYSGVVTGIAKFSDGSGRTLTYSAPSTSAGGGAVSINASTGDFTYTPTVTQRRNAGLSTTDSFTVTVSNGVRSTTQTISVAVDPGTPAAGNPWVRSANRTTGVVTGIAKFTEPVGRTLTYSASPTSAGGGAVSINSATGDFTYTPTQALRQNAGPNTTDTIVVTASNGLRSTTQTISVPVDPNARPVVGNLTLNYRDDGVVDGTFTVTDADSDRVTFTADSPTNGAMTAFNPATGAFTYTPTIAARHNAAADNASYADRNATFTLTANDGRGGITDYGVALAIAPLNNAPTGTGTLGAPSDLSGQASGNLTFTDPDNDPLRYSVAVSPGRGSVAFDPAANGAFTYTPTPQARHNAAADGVGPQTDTFTLAVDDGHGGRVTLPFSVAIVPFNAPLADTATVGPSDPYTASMVVSVYDPDGDVPTYTVVSDPSKGTLSVNGGSVVYTPYREISHPIAAGAPPEDDNFVLEADDGHGSRVTVPVTLTIGPANYIPIFATLSTGTPDAQTGRVSGVITATDAVDDDVRTYSVVSSPVNGGTVTIDSQTGAFTYTPSGSGRQSAVSVPTAVGLSAGRWGRDQVMTAQRRYPGCAEAGGLCEVSGFGDPYVDTYWGYGWGSQPSWSTGDYVKLVDTGRTFGGGAPDLALIQYASNGTQKQVIAASGYVESLGSGILYVGTTGYTRYYISNTMGIARYSTGSYSYLVDTAYPNRSQLANYVVTTSPLDSGQVLASTDTFTVAVTDGHGGRTTTTISVPILPIAGV